MKVSQTSQPQKTAPARKGKPGPWSGEAFEAVCKAAGQVFYQCGPPGQPMRFLGASKPLLGVDNAILKGGRPEWCKRVYPDDVAEVAKMDAEAAVGKSQAVEYRYLCASGEIIWVRDTQCPARDAATGGLVLVGSLTDITQTRQIASRLRHYQKMMAFGELAKGIAHDFNNVLTLVNGYTELLQAEAGAGAAEKEYLDQMITAVERGRELTSQLHRFTHFKQECPAPINLVALLRDCRRLLRRLTPENIELVLSEKTEAAWVKADPQALESLLLYLAVNACEAMPQGGRLEFEITQTRKTKNTRCFLIVRDTRAGIREADRKRIFEPGFTTRKQACAEGLGLGVCRKIVERCGGRITGESAPGKGNEFRVALPALALPVQNAPAEKKKMAAGRGEEILIVEDDASVRQALARMVVRLGYKAHCASNGEEARRMLEKETKIQLVITDLVMPIMSGEELSGIIQSQWPGIPVILTSGYDSSLQEKPNHTQNRLFMPKPVALNNLARHIRQLIDV